MTSTFSRRLALRGAAGTAVGVVAGGALAGCTGDGDARRPPTPLTPGPTTAPTHAPARHEVVLHGDARVTLLGADPEASLAASRALLARCTAVVVSAPTGADVRAGRRTALSLGLPLLLTGPGLAAELDRLRVRTVVRATASPPTTSGTPTAPDPSAAAPALPSGPPREREVVEAVDGAAPVVAGLPARGPEGDALLLLAPDARVPAVLTPLLGACGADRLTLHHVDPRLDPDDAARLRRAGHAVVLAVGDDLGPHLAQRVRTVRYAHEVPGGGYLPFPGRRMVALYGHPRTADLGMLGEQGPAASVRRVRRLAARYARITGDPVVPAFELIATVAAGAAGTDGSYSLRTPVEVLRPWVDTARRAGVYVVLDLQPGRSDFLDQARHYEPLLLEPHVGLALDPEWRLGPSDTPLHRIGHVGIDEVNRVGRWLARLVRDHDLPPKVLTLHEFRTSMVRDRAALDTGLDEVQWLVHADGQGTQAQKAATWSALRRDLPDGVFLGWKNFEDEDHPMLTPEQTVARVHPTPSFISYQ